MAVAEGLLCSGRNGGDKDALAECRLKLEENGAASAGVGGLPGGSLLDDED